MKIRESFVTNSSSSSYIIAFKNSGEKDKYSELLNNITNLILQSNDSYETDEATIFTTEDGIKDYIKDIYGYTDITFEETIAQDECAKDEYEAMMKYLNMGYKIAYKNVGYSDETLKSVINLMDECDENFILVMGDD